MFKSFSLDFHLNYQLILESNSQAQMLTESMRREEKFQLSTGLNCSRT
jgi:hypothetical protein